MKARSQSTRRERLLDIVRSKSTLKHRSLSRMQGRPDDKPEENVTPPSSIRRNVERVDLSNFTTPRKSNARKADGPTPPTVSSIEEAQELRHKQEKSAQQTSKESLDHLRKDLSNDFSTAENALKASRPEKIQEDHPLDEQSVFSGHSVLSGQSSMISGVSDAPFDEKVARMKLKMKARNQRRYQQDQDKLKAQQERLATVLDTAHDTSFCSTNTHETSNVSFSSSQHRRMNSVGTTSTASTAPTMSPLRTSNSNNNSKLNDSINSDSIPQVNRSTVNDEHEMKGLIQNLDLALSNIARTQQETSQRVSAMSESPVDRDAIDPNIQTKFSESMNRENRLEKSFESGKSVTSHAESKAESYFTDGPSDTDYSSDSEWTGGTSGSESIASRHSREIRRKKVKKELKFNVLGSLFENEFLRKRGGDDDDEKEEKKDEDEYEESNDLENLLLSVRDTCCNNFTKK